MQFIHFCLNLFMFQTSQTAQRHLYDCLSLNIIQSKTFHQDRFTFLNGIMRTNNRDNFIDIIQCSQQTFEDMSALFCFFEIKNSSAGDDLFLELDVFFQHLF